MNDINEMPPKCQYCPYWEVCEYPWVCPDREQQDEESIQPNCNQLATDTISRQAESNPLEKCYTCKHVYQRVSDADTLYCRCRKGCRYEEFKPKRSNNDFGKHED